MRTNILKKLKIYDKISNMVRKQNATVVFYKEQDEIEIFNLIQKIRKETPLVMHDIEAIQIFKLVQSALKIDGDVAEVGCFMGGSSRII